MHETELGWGHGGDNILAMNQSIGLFAQKRVIGSRKLRRSHTRHAKRVHSFGGEAKLSLCPRCTQRGKRRAKTVSENEQAQT